MVVAASLVASTVQVGATMSFPAVIYTDLIEAYDVSTSLAGVPSMAASVGSNVAGKTTTPFPLPYCQLCKTCASCKRLS